MADIHYGIEYPNRVWERTYLGWASREATPDDKRDREHRAREWHEKRGTDAIRQA